MRKMLIPAEIIQTVITRIDVKDESLKGLLNGKPLMKDDMISSLSTDNENIISSLSSDNENRNFAVFNKDKFVGIYRASSLSSDKDNSIIAKPEFVLN